MEYVQRLYAYIPDNIRRFMKFAIVGGSGVIVNEVLFVLLKSYFVHPVMETTFVTLIVIIYNFILNYFFTWGDKKGRMLTKFFTYVGVALIGLLWSDLTLHFLVQKGMDSSVANLFGIGIGTVSNFILNHKVTWGHKC